MFGNIIDKVELIIKSTIEKKLRYDAMLVVVKKPHAIVEITGSGLSHILSAIKSSFEDVQIIQEDDVPDRETAKWKDTINKVEPGDVLWAYRDKAELTLRELSEMTGIAIPHLSAMENGKRNIGKLSAEKLGQALKCNYRRFL